MFDFHRDTGRKTDENVESRSSLDHLTYATMSIILSWILFLLHLYSEHKTLVF